MLDRPLWPVGQGLTSKRLGNNLKLVRLGNRIGEGSYKFISHLSNAEKIISIEKKCLGHILIELVISNDLSQVFFYDLGEYLMKA